MLINTQYPFLEKMIATFRFLAMKHPTPPVQRAVVISGRAEMPEISAHGPTSLLWQ